MSPDGGLATVLKTGKPVSNLRNFPTGTQVELVSKATPLYVFGKQIGVVAITKDIQDIVKLSKQLEKSEIMVQNLSEKLDHFVKAVYSFDDIMDQCSMQNVIEMAKIASQTDTTVMIQGKRAPGKK